MLENEWWLDYSTQNFVIFSASVVGDGQRFSTTTTTQPGTSPRDLITPIIGLIDAFQWRSLAVVVDRESASKNAPRVYGFVSYLRTQFEGLAGHFDVGFYEVDSSRDVDPYHVGLSKAALHSRSRTFHRTINIWNTSEKVLESWAINLCLFWSSYPSCCTVHFQKTFSGTHLTTFNDNISREGVIGKSYLLNFLSVKYRKNIPLV